MVRGSHSVLWFSFATKTGRHDKTEILLNVKTNVCENNAVIAFQLSKKKKKKKNNNK